MHILNLLKEPNLEEMGRQKVYTQLGNRTLNAQQREIKKSKCYYATRTRPDAGIELALVERYTLLLKQMFHVSIAESLATRLLLRNSSRVAKR
jgi:hypothetical protein